MQTLEREHIHPFMGYLDAEDFSICCVCALEYVDDFIEHFRPVSEFIPHPLERCEECSELISEMS